MSGRRGFRDWIIKLLLNTVGKNMLKDLLQFKWLEGRRTLVAAILISGLTLALNMGWLDDKTYSTVVAFLTSVGLLTAAVHKPTV